MLKILWISNVPWSSGGYGTETARVVERMHDAGYKVDVLSNYGLQETHILWKNKVMVWPGSQFTQSQVDVIEGYCEQLNPDVVITLWDVHGYPPDFGFKRGVRWVPWLPIDREPLPETIKASLKSAYWILPWVEHARKVIEDGGFTNQTIIPLSVDTSIFRPLVGVKCHKVVDGKKIETGEIATKDMFKSGMGLTDEHFVVGVVGINQDTRKNIHKVIKAVGMLRDEIPELRLRLHAPAYRPGGLNLPEVVDRANITDITAWTPPHKYFLGLTFQEMASMYNGMDVLALPSSGEGFGLPLVEANACGIPTIFTNCTSMSEIAYGIGIDPVTTEIYPEPTPSGLPDCVYRFCVRDEHIADSIRALHKIWKEDKDEWARIGANARQSAMRFDANYVFETYWKPTLDMLEAKIAEEQELVKWLT